MHYKNQEILSLLLTTPSQTSISFRLLFSLSLRIRTNVYARRAPREVHGQYVSQISGPWNGIVGQRRSDPLLTIGHVHGTQLDLRQSSWVALEDEYENDDEEDQPSDTDIHLNAPSPPES